MTRISSVTGGFAGYSAMSRSFAAGGGGGDEYTGAVMLFAQTAAPTGWTKLTTDDDCTLRVVNGTVSSGGTVAFSSIFSTITPTGTTDDVTVGSVGNTTLSTPQMGPHTHTAIHRSQSSGFFMAAVGGSPISRNTDARLFASSPQPVGGGAHTHPSPGGTLATSFVGSPLDFNIKYVDVIVATRT